MRAARIHDDGRLMLEDVPEPQVRTGEVLVRLHAASVNRRDLFVRDPPSDAYRFPTPFIPGLDGAGTRCDTGEEVVIYPGIGWGDDDRAAAKDFRLLGGAVDGTYAEFIRVPTSSCYPKPARLSWAEAAALPVVGITAYRGLFPVGELQAGQRVLVLGAGSGLSIMATLLAIQCGAEVFVTSSTDDKLALARELGAKGGVLYTDAAWPAALLDLVGGEGVDLVFDSVGATLADSVRCLKRGGAVIAVGGTGGGCTELDIRSVYLGWRSIRGTTLGSPRDFERFLEMADGALWRPPIDSRWTLADVEEAHARLHTGKHFGKLILEF